jgi:chromate transporter
MAAAPAPAAGAGAAAPPDVEAAAPAPPDAPAAANGALNGAAPAASLHRDDSDDEAAPVEPATWRALLRVWAILGWTAFGGPAAHVAMFQKLFVEKLRWASYTVFAELLMLGQCMPGPTSTQMGFALGVLKKGLSGGLASGVLFQGPGFLILSVLGWAAARVLSENIGWLNGLVAGLAAAGIALVASAAQALVRNVCKRRTTLVLATAAAVVAFYYPKPWTFPALIVAGGVVTAVLMRKETVKVDDISAGVETLGFSKAGGAALAALWIAALAALVALAADSDYYSNRELHWASAFYRTGSVIFGGGQVVLPMLVNDVVAADCADAAARCCAVDAAAAPPPDCTSSADPDANAACKCSWMSANEFYAGLAVAQAMPGPLFNLAAYLGAVIAQNAGVLPLTGILICWVGLFAPGIIVIFAVLPWWGAVRRCQLYRRALPGLNSAAVGLVVAAVFQLGIGAYAGSPFGAASVCVGILAFAATEVLAAPAPFVVLGGGALGVIAWATGMN